MAGQQEAVTNRLVNVIQSIQVGRKTGTLTARRGESVTLEEGVVTFVNGQVAEASVGRRTGSVALNWLSTWGYCRYLFISPTMAEVAIAQNPSPASPPGERRVTDPFLSLGVQKPSATLSPTIQRDSLSPARGATAPLAASDEEKAALGPTDIATAPYRTRQAKSALSVIERTGFSRTHRHLFLLVDGYRTTVELAHLIGRNEQELAELLDDLQRAGLVRVPGMPA